MRKHLTEENAAQIIREWDEKSVEDFAAEFGVAVNTVRSMVTAIKKKRPELCPRKSRRTRQDVVEAALKIIDAENDDRIEDAA